VIEQTTGRSLIKLALLLSAATLAAQAGDLRLPPLATVRYTDDSGQSWRWSGDARGAPDVVDRDFSKCLQQAGWQRDRTISLGARGETVLITWLKGDEQLLLKLTSEGAGRTAFAVGFPATKRAMSTDDGPPATRRRIRLAAARRSSQEDQ
jgi:hypothetical protein